MRAILAVLTVLAAAAAQAQSININLDPGNLSAHADIEESSQAGRVEVKAHRSEEHRQDGYRVRYERNPEGRTLIRVLQPERAYLELWDGNLPLAQEDIPVSVSGRPDVFYRFIVRWPNGAIFEKKLAAKAGMTMTLWVAGPNVTVPPPPPAPVSYCMPEDSFASLKGAIEGESFSSNKLDVLRTASEGAQYCAAQVGEILDLYSFSSDKIDALTIMKSRITDRNNNFKILGHFTFSSDKEKAQWILSQ